MRNADVRHLDDEDVGSGAAKPSIVREEMNPLQCSDMRIADYLPQHESAHHQCEFILMDGRGASGVLVRVLMTGRSPWP